MLLEESRKWDKMENIKVKFNEAVECLCAECDKNLDSLINDVDEIIKLISKENVNMKSFLSSGKPSASRKKTETALLRNSVMTKEYFSIIKNLYPKKWTAFQILSFLERPMINDPNYTNELSKLRNMLFETEGYDLAVESFSDFMMKINKDLTKNYTYAIVTANFIHDYTISLLKIKKHLPSLVKKLKDSISEMKKYMDQNIMIPRHIIKNANGKNIANDLINENMKQRIIDLAKEYNSMLESKRNAPVSKSAPKEEVKVQSREERIAEYEKEKQMKTNNFYIDSEDTLTKEEKDAITQYANMVSSADENESLTILLELLPLEKFADEKILLNSVINKLKRKNINHLTNEVLIVLNNRLKDINNCKKKTNKSKK